MTDEVEAAEIGQRQTIPPAIPTVIRILFNGGWGLIRASNTQPALVLRFEAGSQARLVEMQQCVDQFLAKVIG